MAAIFKPAANFVSGCSVHCGYRAVRVTGLVTVVPATQFTLIGKGIMLVLIQIGGLGVIACTSAFFLSLLGKRSVSGAGR